MTNQESKQGNQGEPHRRNDEIELADVARVIYRRRWIIIAGTLLVALVAAVYTFALPKVYQFQAVLEVGELPMYQYPQTLELGDLQIANRSRHFIEPPEEVASRIRQLGHTGSVEEVSDGESLEMDPAPLKDVTVSTVEETALVEVELRSTDTDAPRRFLKAALETVVNDHDSLLEDEKRARRKEMEIAKTELRWLETEPEYVQQQIETMDARRRETEEYLDRAKTRRTELRQWRHNLTRENPADPVAALLITDELESLERHLQELRRELSFDLPERRRHLRRELHDLNIRLATASQELTVARRALDEATPTRIVDLPAGTGRAISPNYQLNIALGIILGGFLSLFLAFLVEFWSKNKHRIVGTG